MDIRAKGGKFQEGEAKIRAMAARPVFCLPACDACEHPSLLYGFKQGTWPTEDTFTIPGGGDIYPGYVPVFFFEFRVSDSILNWLADGRPLRQGALPHPDLPTLTWFVVGRDQLLENQNLASQLLSAVGVPSVLHPPFVRTIYSEASSLANETPDYIDPSVIPIVARVQAWPAGDEERAMALSMISVDKDDEVMA